MVTRFRALACPVDAATGDQRRFAEGSIEAADCPMPARHTREDVGGHDGAITIAVTESVDLSTAGEIWLEGYLLAPDRETMPRLAEDVAEATLLIESGVVGFSVDLDDFEATYVRAGTDEEITMEDLDDPDLRVEMLITKGRIRSATLVAIPAFVETNHTITLTVIEDEEPTEGDEVVEEEASVAALVASMSSPAPLPFSAFTPPVAITGPTPMTYDFSVTPAVAYGHVATWSTCHAGFRDSCVLAPRDPGSGYRDFHIHRTETDKGTVYAGRITAGGRHPSSDDFAIDAHAVRRHHDGMTEVARVLASEDEWGLFVCGPIVDDLDDGTMRILSRRKVSPDWRETVDGLAMIEVLALADGPRQHSEPGFPIVAGFSSGRQVALCAALGPEADDAPRVPRYAEIFRTAYGVIREEEAKAAEALVERDRLAEALAADTAMMAEELLNATGE
jgi:hypothetical protein